MKPLSSFIALMLFIAPRVMAERVVTLSGDIDAGMLQSVVQSNPDMETLDMSRATIVAYNGEKLSNGRTTSPAGMLPEYLLAGSRLTKIELPAGLRSIGDGALAATPLIAVAIPEGVETIGNAAFDGCTSLADVKLPTTLTSIGSLAFKGCTSLTHIELPQSVTTIDESAFNHCTALESVEWSRELESIGADAFNGTALQVLDLTRCIHLSSVGDWAFAHITSLTDVTLPSHEISAMGQGVFFDCNNLRQIVSSPVTINITPYMYKGTAITDTKGVLTDKVAEVGQYALSGTDQVVEMTLPASLTRIGDHGMEGMSSLSSVDATALTEIPTLGEDALTGTARPDVTLLASARMADVFIVTPQWQEFNVVISGLNDPASTPETVEHKLEMKREGSTLWLRSDAAINVVTLTAIDGRELLRHMAGGELNVSLSVENVPSTAPVIVTTHFSDNTTRSIKIKL